MESSYEQKNRANNLLAAILPDDRLRRSLRVRFFRGEILPLTLRSREAASRRMRPGTGLMVRDAPAALLTMRVELSRPLHQQPTHANPSGACRAGAWLCRPSAPACRARPPAPSR